MEITRRDLLAGGGSLAIAGLSPAVGRAQSATASLAYGPQTAVYALGAIAEARGFFKTEKLELKLVVGNAGTHGRQTLAAGQALFAHGDASHPLQLSTRGKPCKIIMATQMISSIANVVVRKDLFDAGIDSVEKLAAYKRPNGGKPVIAATAIGSGTWMYGTYTFESKGLGDKVTWVAGGGLNTMLPGLETKQFDAIIAPPGWVVESEAKGFGKAIFDTSKPGVFVSAYGGTVPVLVLYALTETCEQEKAKVQAFVNAMYQGMKWVKATPVDEVYALVGEKLYSGQDPNAVKAELGFDKQTWEYDGRIDKASFERGGKVWYRQGTDIPPAKYEDIVDMTFLEAARAKFG
ncbi:NitT/TauT family transport system substrate-binding protein [Bosea sp. CRIB-10]|uniref:ABC transporter substrate-binding protein n=1 Tax=Bosea sp. CRIB-10 TaxID=378404 RepID=UPI0008EC6176|nr:ABC transporter substrate-binding protein [Bosea sp. CRIB-10]SFD59269.1 NitT/TauT family transport system substrate-binding protein [Bosea sp. CRIB-10]